MLRQAQHERKISRNFNDSTVRPETLEGGTEGFSAESFSTAYSTDKPQRRFVDCSGGLARLAQLLNQLEELIRSKYGNKLPRELAYWLVVLNVNPVIHAA